MSRAKAPVHTGAVPRSVQPNPIALVTGAGKRVGRAIALGLSDDGFRVAVHFNGSAVGAPARLVSEVVKLWGRLDVLVNSAASMSRTPLQQVRESEWDRIFALNLRAPFFCSVAAAKAMGKRGGAIVNISDHMGFESWPDYVPHGVSKAAIAAMTHALAAACAPRVRVNAVAPGFVLAPEGYPAAKERQFARQTPLRRLGSPADVADAVRYLVGAEYVTGEVLFVDGGRHGAR